MQTPSGCVGNLHVEAWAAGLVRFSRQVEPKILVVRLWVEAGLIGGAPGTFGRQMTEAIDEFVKKFVVDWTLDQQ